MKVQRIAAAGGCEDETILEKAETEVKIHVKSVGFLSINSSDE